MALIWDETDFITCLEVIPEVEEYGEFHSFKIEKDGLRLELPVFQYDGDVGITLYRDGIPHPVFAMSLLNCTGVRYVKDKQGEYLEFAPAKSFGSRYDGHSPLPYGVRVAVNPNISIKLF